MTHGGGFANSPYLNSLQMTMGTQAVPANPLYILQPCPMGGGGYHDKTGKLIMFTGLLIVVVGLVVVVFISTVQHQLVSTAINVYNTDIMES